MSAMAKPLVGPAPIDPANRWEMQAFQQMVACLSAAGHRDDLETLLRQHADTPLEPAIRYQLALLCARENQPDECLNQLRKVIAGQREHLEARALAYRLLIAAVKNRIRKQESDGLAELMSEAMAMAPPNVNAAKELEAFKDAMPLAHLRAGKRSEAAAHWEREFKQDPLNPKTLHKLAVLHYWGALSATGPSAEVWEPAIAHLCVLSMADSFWNEWNQRNKDRWGMPLSENELTEFRKGIFEQLVQYLQNQASECKQQGRTKDAAAYDYLLTLAFRERRSADEWRTALSLLGKKGPDQGLLQLPGGYLFFKQYGLVGDSGAQRGFDKMMAQLAGTAAPKTGLVNPAECAARLMLYFSPPLGPIAALLEDRNRPEEALNLLNQLPQKVAASSDAAFLRAKALAGNAGLLASRNQLTDAIASWKQAIQQLDQMKTTPAGAKGLRQSILDQMIPLVQREATRLKADSKLDPAIALLESALPLDSNNAIRDYLCIFYCDRGFKRLGDKNFAGAREEFNRALQLNSNYTRAKEGLSTTNNNEGVAQSDPNLAVPLLQEAVKLNPNNNVAKRNLAEALRARAIAKANSLNQYVAWSAWNAVIDDLVAGAKLLRSNLDDSFFGVVEKAGANGIGPIVAKCDDDLLKNILTNLATAYGNRRGRRGY